MPNVRFDIPAQSLESALLSFSQQAGVQLVVADDTIKGLSTSGVQGEYSAGDALELLLQGSGLSYRVTDERTIAIGAPRSKQVSQNAGENALQLAQNADRGPTKDAEAAQDRAAEQSAHPAESSEAEVVVTGTQIRGATNIASPISIHTREEIDRSGAGTVARFLQTLPENFKGGASEGTLYGITGGGTALNSVGGTGVNLRGLGNDSTLVLLNGRRLAPGNTLGNFVDVSLIPVAAVERMEVVPDGASALYGSDAVGGVVNFIMRKDFTGAETRLRYGSVTEGKLREYQLGQTLGTGWSGGSALLSYEYFDQSPLALNDKSWVRNPTGVMEALPLQKRHGVFASVEQSVGPLQLFADATYADRLNNRRHAFAIAPGVPFQTEYHSSIEAISATAGARTQLANKHEIELSTSYGDSSTIRHVVWDMLPGIAVLADSDSDTSVFAVDAKLTGGLFALPSGPVLYATGLHYREETFKNFDLLSNLLSFKNDRHLEAGFVELRVPLLGPKVRQLPQLELTLAGRYENYSDFGSTADPKIGLVWQPSPAIRLRGTWGTSFKAPLLNDLNPVPDFTFTDFIFDPVAGANVPILLTQGGNPALNPETATTWTIGADWTPESLPGFKARTTYYDIAYTDRITAPGIAYEAIIGGGYPDWLSYENILAQFITRNPSAAQIQAIADVVTINDLSGAPGGIDPFSVAVLIDVRTVNLTSVDTSGIDLGLSYTKELGAMTVETGIDGTYILQLDNKLSPAIPVIKAVDTIFNPANLKARARATVQQGGFSAALFVNYVDSYTDTRNAASIPVASWTTLDANVGYRFARDNGLWSGVSLDFGVTNLTDQAPPYIAPGSEDIAAVVFDGANADTRGRFIYAQLEKRFQ